MARPRSRCRRSQTGSETTHVRPWLSAPVSLPGYRRPSAPTAHHARPPITAWLAAAVSRIPSTALVRANQTPSPFSGSRCSRSAPDGPPKAPSIMATGAVHALELGPKMPVQVVWCNLPLLLLSWPWSLCTSAVALLKSRRCQCRRSLPPNLLMFGVSNQTYISSAPAEKGGRIAIVLDRELFWKVCMPACFPPIGGYPSHPCWSSAYRPTDVLLLSEQDNTQCVIHNVYGGHTRGLLQQRTSD